MFENLDVATAPAHEVVITDQLNAGAVDLSTFILGPISFGDTLIVPPAGLSQYATDVDLRPANNVIVRVNAGIDAITGVARWHFLSLDPTTMLPPEDWRIGFLPPNITPPEGQGAVLFTVAPKMDLATGIEIRNWATILFDTNAPIETPEWLNTIDKTSPVSYVQPLATTRRSPAFNVTVAGSDVGSGVQDYTLYVSEDDGPFVAFISNTTATSVPFTGQRGKRYAFYSIAKDAVGNVEPAKTAAEAVTRMLLDPLDILPPTASFAISAPTRPAVLMAGGVTSIEFTLTPIKRFRASVPLTCTVPKGLTCSLSTNVVDFDGSNAQKVTATVASSPTARKRGYSVVLSGKLGALERRRNANVTVQ